MKVFFPFLSGKNTALPVNNVLSLIYILWQINFEKNQTKSIAAFDITMRKSNSNFDYHFLNIPFAYHWCMHILGKKDSELAVG